MSNHILPVERKLFEAAIAFVSLKCSLVLLIGLSACIVLLYAVDLLLSACFELCTQIATLWLASSSLEKLLFIALTWGIVAWAYRCYRSVHDARI